jgi:hypothetical protein
MHNIVNEHFKIPGPDITYFMRECRFRPYNVCDGKISVVRSNLTDSSSETYPRPESD